jgi:hypothetical protein
MVDDPTTATEASTIAGGGATETTVSGYRSTASRANGAGAGDTTMVASHVISTAKEELNEAT